MKFWKGQIVLNAKVGPQRGTICSTWPVSANESLLNADPLKVIKSSQDDNSFTWALT
jgi:hypothetical protein